MKRRSHYFLVCLPAMMLATMHLFAQPGSISGPTTVDITATEQYFFSNGTTYGSPQWHADGGNVVSQSQGGSSYSCTVQWMSSGAKQLNFANGSMVISTLNVTVICSPNPTPTLTPATDLCSPRAITYTGTPPTNVTWYWQTSATGTSTTNSTNTFSATTSGTYYVRAYRAAYNCWSASTVSTTVTVSPAPVAPVASNIVASTNTCGVKTINCTNIPSGVTWYWQGTDPNGTDVSFNAASLYSVAASGTYYVRARNIAAPYCWSTATAKTVSVINPVPPNPNSFSYCEWETMALSTTGYTGSLKWYDASNQLLATSPTYTPTNPVPGNYTYTVKSSLSSCESTPATISLEVKANCDQYLNSVENTGYSIDASGNQITISSSKSYSDAFGATLQSQAKSLTNDLVLASQPVKDVNNNSMLSSLPAPINSNSFVYRHRFITNATGQRYSPNDFDLRTTGAGEVNNPKPVGNGGAGTLGWYYSSSNNLEPLTATSTYPYTRSYTPDGPDAAITKSSGPSADYKMGGGHESVSERQKIAVGELDHYFKLRGHFVSTPSQYNTNLLNHVSFATTANFPANQNVTVSASNNVITATCNQTNSTPGISPIGGFIAVTPGKAYRFSVKGYKNSATAPAKLYVGPISGTNIVWPGPLLPTDGPASEAWVGVTFTVPAGVTSIRVGVLWFPAAIGDQFNLTGVDLRLDVPTASIGYKYIATDADGKKVVTFVDADGRTLATATLTGSTYDNWSYTYYNDLGQVVANVAPNGVVISSTLYPKFVTTYSYDHLGRLLEVNSTDEGKTQYVYNIDGKIRFSQNQEQFNASPQRFSYSNYDYMGRLAETGEYTMSGTGYYVFEPSTVTTPVTNSILTVVENNLPFGYDIETIASTVYTGVSKKLDNTRCTDHMFIKYDKSAGLPGGDADHNVQQNIYGQVSKTLNAFGITWYSYDEFGRLAWTKQSVPDISYKTVDYTYNFDGKVILMAYQKGKTDAFYHHYVYDSDQRLSQVFTTTTGTVNASTDLRANYKYYLHGPLKRMELMNGSQSIQGIDYLYNVSGSLKTINNGDPAKDPGFDGISGANSAFMKDAFGETLHYYDNDFAPASSTYQVGSVDFTGTGLTNQFGGNIRAAAYNNSTLLAPGTTDHEKHIYGYQYDGLNQLTDAQWGTVSGSSPNFTQAQRETISLYDKNGNIQGLSRTGKEEQSIASYDYIYEQYTNKLDKVNDNGSLFIDYTYDAIGRMTKQDEGTGKVYNVTYNVYGKVELVRNGSNQALIDYVYDDRGNLIKRVSYTAGVASKFTFYVRDVNGNVLAIYEQPLPGGTVQLVERPIYGAGRIATYKPLTSTFFYEVTDHLGNVRSVIGAPKTDTYTATMESGVNEEPPFTNVNATSVTFSTAAHSGTRVAQLNNLEPAGPAISLPVSPGDKIDVDAWAYYFGAGSSDPIDLTTMITSIAGAFGGQQGGAGETGKIYDRVNAGFGSLLGGGGSAPFPSAFITCIVYDQNYVPQFYASAAVAGGSSGTLQHVVAPQVTIEQPGYVYICLYNRSDDTNPVYFDDFNVVINHSPIVAGSDYYPFGLTMNGTEIKDEAYRYGYQGQYSEENETTGWNEFDLRVYDPRIGRWLRPDPYGQYASPYLAMGNNPGGAADPDGGWVGEPIRVINGGILDLGIEIVATRLSQVSVSTAALVAGIGISGIIPGYPKEPEVVPYEDKRGPIGRFLEDFSGFSVGMTRTLTFGFGPEFVQSDRPQFKRNVESGEFLGQLITTLFGSRMSPGGSPSMVTPHGQVPVTTPVTVPTVTVLDIHGQVNAKGFDKKFDEELAKIKDGKGTPRTDANGNQKIFEGRELTGRLKWKWSGSLEWEVPGTNHRILEKVNPDGTSSFARIINHDYAHPYPF